jgi:hypothetical protein
MPLCPLLLNAVIVYARYCIAMSSTCTALLYTSFLTGFVSGAFAKFQKWLLASSCLSVCLSVNSALTRWIFVKFCMGNILKSLSWSFVFGKNRTRISDTTWRPKYIYDYISQYYFCKRGRFKHRLYRKSKHAFHIKCFWRDNYEMTHQCNKNNSTVVLQRNITLEDGNDSLSRNVGKKLPILAT